MAGRDINKKRSRDRAWYQRNKHKRLAYKNTIRERNRKFINDYKAKMGCLRCGENNPIVLDYHHRDPSEKDIEVALLITHTSLEKIIDEIKKCDVYCANHHRVVHHEIRSGVINSTDRNRVFETLDEGSNPS